MMKSLGNHFLLDLWGVSPTILNDDEELERLLLSAAEAGGAHPVECWFRFFEPQGITGVILLNESHLTIHTWPELAYAAVDVFTCGPASVGHSVSREILAVLQPDRHEMRRLCRGLLPDGLTHTIHQ
uniref:S-adenosylmethionine decarboxylase proenzyme n=1 Tax=uncultured sulfate-reducing bacterium TaxID=153939 RepID=Q3IBQ8_9BACT|nr:S-adenosylmethionine decarboxylase [uncultured sulfate-reducing bacterium]